MTKSEIDAVVLRVLAGQSPDYLIHPDASAFLVEGLDAETVAASLERLAAAGHAVEEESVVMRYATDEDGRPVFGEDGQQVVEPVLDEQGREVVVAAGWRITEAGRAAAQGVTG